MGSRRVRDALATRGGDGTQGIKVRLREVLRHDDVDHDDEAAPRGAALTRHAIALDLDVLCMLTAGRHLYLDGLALEDALHLERATTHGLERGDVLDAEEVIALALEALILTDLDANDKVSRTIPTDTGLTVSLDLEGLAGMDAGGNIDLHGLVIGRAALSAAGLARVVDDLTRAMALRTLALSLHLAEDGTLDGHNAAGSVTARARGDLATFRGAGAIAIITRSEAIVGDGLGDTTSRVREADAKRDAHVAARGTSRPSATSRGSPSKEGGEDVIHAEAAEDIGDIRITTAEACGAVRVPVAVIVSALLLVREDGVRLVDLLEALLRIRSVVYVRVEGACLLDVGALDGSRVSVMVNAEDLVIIDLSFHARNTRFPTHLFEPKTAQAVEEELAEPRGTRIACGSKTAHARDHKAHEDGDCRSIYGTIHQIAASVLPPAGTMVQKAAGLQDQPDADAAQGQREHSCHLDEHLDREAEDDERQRKADHLEALGRTGAETLAGHANAADEVAGRGAIRAGVAHAAHTNGVAVVATCGDIDDDLARREDATGTATGAARIRNDLTRPLALRADHIHDADAKETREVHRDVARATAGGTRPRVVSVHGAHAVTDLARDVALIGNALAVALLGLLVVDVKLINDIAASLGIVSAAARTSRALRAKPTAERKAPEAAHAPEGVALGTGRAIAAGSGEGVAGLHGVITAALVGVREHGVGLGDLLELLLGVRLLVDIRVKLASLLLEGLTNLFLGRIMIDAEDRVIVFIVHRGHGLVVSRLVGPSRTFRKH